MIIIKIDVNNVATDLADILHSFSVVKEEDPRNEGDINYSTIPEKKKAPYEVIDTVILSLKTPACIFTVVF